MKLPSEIPGKGWGVEGKGTTGRGAGGGALGKKGLVAGLKLKEKNVSR